MKAATLVMIAGCSSDPQVPGDLPAPPAQVKITMSEFVFVYDADVPSGRVVFEVVNAGDLPHRLSLIPLDSEMPSIVEMLADRRSTIITPFASVRVQPPGGRGAFAVDLEAGQRYAMICTVYGRDGQSHARKGMASEFQTPGPEAAAAPAQPARRAVSADRDTPPFA